MDNYIYYTPTKVFFGLDYENNIGKIIKEYGFSNILIHYGQNSVVKSGLLDRVLDSVTKENINYTLLGGVVPNPLLSKVLEGVKICKDKKIDFILAIGGGSVIDSAKLIALGAKTDLNPWLFSIQKEKPHDGLKVGAILTLAAAGSEMSQSCVITNDETKEKRGFNNELNRILFAIENPKLTYTVSKYQTACGIVDIMMHTMERYYARLDEKILSDYMALSLLKAVKENGITAYNNPEDYNSRALLMWASSLSHNDITGVGRPQIMPVHQIEHEISGMFEEVAHGAGLSAIYCSWARYTYLDNIKRFAEFAYEVFNVSRDVDEKEAALLGIDLLEEYFKQINMPTSLSELGIDTSITTLKQLAYNFTFKGQRVVNDFKVIDYDACLEILKMAR